MQDFQSFLAPAKINLFLHITGQRADGYHTLQSVFQQLDFYDTVYLKPTQTGEIKRVNDISNVPASSDLCVRAALALKQATGCAQGVEIALEKRIPIGGGLGGGSSDAATVLLALNHLWNLNLSRAELMQIGLTLGADVPIFIFGQNAWAEGIGEQLTPITLPTRYYLVLTPNVHVSTRNIFANSTLTKDTKPLKMADFSRDESLNLSSVIFRNDLEAVVCKEFPAVATTLEWLSQYSQVGFGSARMSGSGSSVFLAVNSKQRADELLALKPDYTTGFVAKGIVKHPHVELAL
ncbi:MAG: 4-(cytidine 5'-diphospho)-2-C-methyl-D-erythritol kinase [Bdellovibrio sp.]|nr:4-(cytidine 5'-diphospho)-2-C-methyl-D-erythritol kinase [Methylotenera sp.]